MKIIVACALLTGTTMGLLLKNVDAGNLGQASIDADLKMKPNSEFPNNKKNSTEFSLSGVGIGGGRQLLTIVVMLSNISCTFGPAF